MRHNQIVNLTGETQKHHFILKNIQQESNFSPVYNLQGAEATPSVIIIFPLVPYRQNGNALLILYFEQRHVAAGSE